MIEKMKIVCIATQNNRKDELLHSLRKLGILHLSEKETADPQLIERFSFLSRFCRELRDYQVKGRGERELTDEEFEELHKNTASALQRKDELRTRLSELLLEEERIKPWGDFDPQEIRDLSKVAELHFYRVDKKEYSVLCKDETVRFIRLKPLEKMETVAVIGASGIALHGSEFLLPGKGLSELKKEIDLCKKEIAECDLILTKSAEYLKVYSKQLLKIQNAVEYSSADAALHRDGGIVWLTGYVPEADKEKFICAAKEHKWAWLMDDVDENDANVPTKIRYNKATALIKPISDVLGIVPGYREYDISFWFLAFFALFFAMIIGDAGYGTIFLIGTIALNIRLKKITNVVLLLYLVSLTTIVWGSLTGTWFGLEEAMNIPFLKALVIPEFANYPEYFQVTSTEAQNNVMKFCFSIGVVQLALACIMNIRRKLKSRNLSWVADLGWLISVSALYLMVLYLVIGETVNLPVVASMIGLGFVLVILFGGMSPDKTFAQGIKAGLGNIFTVFLDTISAFGNVMSYIRLFAVGMASLAIAQSFNDMASGFSGALFIVGIAIMIIGHALNIIMGFLSVVVHGVRLNLLEFSGQLGMEWSGIAYDPFRELEKIKNN